MKWHAGISSKDYGSNTFYGVKWDDQFEHTLKTYTAIQAENKNGAFHLKPSIYWNHGEDRFELFRDAADKYPFNYHRTDIFGVNLNGYFDWTLGRTAIGAELRNEDLVSGNLGEPLGEPKHINGTDRMYEYGINRTNISFVLEHNVILERFTLSAGLVAVKNSWNNMNMKVYPGVDVSYRIGNDFKVYASYNTSLRMPSVTELYYSVGGHKADKYLKPELVGKEADNFRSLCEMMEAITIDGKRLHTAIRYGVSQAILDAVAKATNRFMCEVVADEYGCTVRNYTEIISYSPTLIILLTPIGRLMLCGSGMTLMDSDSRELKLTGRVRSAEFSGD